MLLSQVLLLWYASVASGVTNYQPSTEDLTDREIANVERIDARDHAMIVHRAFAGDGIPGGSDDTVRLIKFKPILLDSFLGSNLLENMLLLDTGGR